MDDPVEWFDSWWRTVVVLCIGLLGAVVLTVVVGGPPLLVGLLASAWLPLPLAVVATVAAVLLWVSALLHFALRRP